MLSPTITSSDEETDSDRELFAHREEEYVMPLNKRGNSDLTEKLIKLSNKNKKNHKRGENYQITKAKKASKEDNDNSRKSSRKIAKKSKAPHVLKARTNRRESNYTYEQVDFLLSIVEERLPCGYEEWDLVAIEYRQKYQDTERDGEALKFEYKTMKSKPKPSGKTNVPCQVLKRPLKVLAYSSKI